VGKFFTTLITKYVVGLLLARIIKSLFLFIADRISFAGYLLYIIGILFLFVILSLRISTACWFCISISAVFFLHESISTAADQFFPSLYSKEENFVCIRYQVYNKQ